jgi:hypothetical protein
MEKNREIACEILEVFEELLDKYNIVINSDDRKEMILSGEHNVAAIYGEEYFLLEDEITNILNQ